jgi:hypothetical protein
LARHHRAVPRISAFYGIVITMYWRDHPPPHFHAAYAGQVAEIDIASLEVLDGCFRHEPFASSGNGATSTGTSSGTTGLARERTKRFCRSTRLP